MIVALLLVLAGLALVYAGARGYGVVRESRHAKTLRNIRELEMTLGISPSDYWSDTPPVSADLAIAKRSFIPPLVELIRSPYSFSRPEEDGPKEEVNLGGLGVRMIDIPPGQLPSR